MKIISYAALLGFLSLSVLFAGKEPPNQDKSVLVYHKVVNLLGREYLAVQKGFGPIEFICLDKNFPHQFSTKTIQ
jgi:hypothetical protein